MSKELTKAKNKAWAAFSLYVRTRDCILTTGTTEWGACVTCGKVKHIKELQAGHYVDGRSNSVLFVEEIVNAQCYSCNCMKNGNKDSYNLFMLKKYSKKKIESFIGLKYEQKKYTVNDYKNIEKKYIKKTEALNARSNNE